MTPLKSENLEDNPGTDKRDLLEGTTTSIPNVGLLLELILGIWPLQVDPALNSSFSQLQIGGILCWLESSSERSFAAAVISPLGSGQYGVGCVGELAPHKDETACLIWSCQLEQLVPIRQGRSVPVGSKVT